MATWADFSIAALDRLGRAAPWIIVAGLTGFGVVYLQKLNSDSFAQIRAVAQSERTQAREDFQAANAALKDTYRAANTLYKDVTTSMRESLAELKKLETELRDKQGEIFEKRLEVEKRVGELADRRQALLNAEGKLKATQEKLFASLRQVTALKEEANAATDAQQVAERQRDNARRELEGFISRLDKERSSLEETRKELSTTQINLDLKRRELDRLATRVRDANDVLGDLARLNVNDSDRGIVDLKARAKAITPQLSALLEDYRDNGQSNLDERGYVGANLKQLLDAAASVDGLYWYVGTREDVFGSEGSQEQFLIAISDEFEGQSTIPNVLILSFGYGSWEKFRENVTNYNTLPDKRLAVVSSASISAIASVRCTELSGSYNGLTSGSISSDRRSTWSDAKQNADLHTLLKEALHIENIEELFSAPNWPVTYSRPELVLKQVPQIISNRREISLSGGPEACLTAYKYKDILSNVEVAVSGVSGDKNREIEEYISNIYRGIFGSNKDYSKQSKELIDLVGFQKEEIARLISSIATQGILISEELGDAKRIIVGASATWQRDFVKLDVESLSRDEAIATFFLSHKGGEFFLERASMFNEQ